MPKYNLAICFAPSKPVISWQEDAQGNRWKKPPQGNNVLLEISNDGRVFTPDAASWAYGFPDRAPIPTPNYNFRFAALVLSLEAGSAVGVPFHWQSIDTSTTEGYVLQHNGSGQQLQLVKPGTGTLQTWPCNVSVGDLFRVEGAVRETASAVTIDVYRDGVLLGSYSDTSASRVTGGGHVGVRMHDAPAGKGIQITYLEVVTAATLAAGPDASTPPAAVGLSIDPESQWSHMASISGGSGRTRWELHRSRTSGFTPDLDTLVAIVDDSTTRTARGWHREAPGTTFYYRAVAVNDAGTSMSAEVPITQEAPVYPPTFTRLNGGQPIFTEADTPITTVYWPYPNTNAAIVAEIAKKYWWTISTDHSGGGGGIYAATSSGLLCTDLSAWELIWGAADMPEPWTQVETFSYLHNPDDPNGRPHYGYFQAANLVEGRQQTFRISSATLAPGSWVYDGPVLHNTAEWVHTGYFKPRRFGPGDFGGVSLLVGGPNGKSGYWKSTDGLNWTLVEIIDNWTMLRHLGKNFGGLAQKVNYGGHQWAISSMQDPGEAGGSGNAGDIIATMEVVDNVTYVGEVKEILLPSLGESGIPQETSNIRWSAPYEEDGELYTIFATDEVAGSGEPYSVFLAKATGGGGSTGTIPTISINQGASASREVGQTFQLSASTTGNPAPTVTWSTSDPDVATVSASGLVTAVGPGTATITARATNSEGAATDTLSFQAIAPQAPVDEPPVPGFSLSVSGRAVSVTSTATDDNAIDSITYDWGDGSAPATTANANHTYAADGTFRIRQTVADGSDQRTYAYRTVQIETVAAPLEEPDAEAIPSPPVGATSVIVNGTDLSDFGVVVNDELTGWKDPPTLAYPRADIPGYASVLVGEPTRRVRTVTAAGWMNAATLSALRAQRDKLWHLLYGRPLEITLAEYSDRILRARYNEAASTPMEPVLIQTRHDIRIVFECEDPFAYELAEQSVVFNAGAPTQMVLGSAPSLPTLMIGGVTSPTLIYRDADGVERARMELAGAVTTGNPLIIDMRRRTLRLADGADASAMLSAGEFFALDPRHASSLTGPWPTLEIAPAASQATATYARAHLSL